MEQAEGASSPADVTTVRHLEPELVALILRMSGSSWAHRITDKAFKSALEADRSELLLRLSALLDEGSSGASGLTALLRRLPRLDTLQVSDCPPRLLPLCCTAQLTSLDLSKSDMIADLSPLSRASRLVRLDLGVGAMVTDLTGLSSSPCLQWLHLGTTRGLREQHPHGKVVPAAQSLDLSPLAHAASLRHLALGDLYNPSRFCARIVDIPGICPLATLVQITYLDLHDCVGVASVTALSHLVGLTHLDLGGCSATVDIRPLARCRAMRDLRISGMYQLTDLGALSAMASLTRLDASVTLVRDLRPLAACPELEHIDLVGCSGIRRVDPLAACTALTYLDLHDGCLFAEYEQATFLRAIRTLRLPADVTMEALEETWRRGFAADVVAADVAAV